MYQAVIGGIGQALAAWINLPSTGQLTANQSQFAHQGHGIQHQIAIRYRPRLPGQGIGRPVFLTPDAKNPSMHGQLSGLEYNQVGMLLDNCQQSLPFLLRQVKWVRQRLKQNRLVQADQ